MSMLELWAAVQVAGEAIGFLFVAVVVIAVVVGSRRKNPRRRKKD